MCLSFGISICLSVEGSLALQRRTHVFSGAAQVTSVPVGDSVCVGVTSDQPCVQDPELLFECVEEEIACLQRQLGIPSADLPF